MPKRKPTAKFPPPLPPEPPAEPLVVEHSSVGSFEAWEDERVVDADLAGQEADGVHLTRCELHRVAFTGAQLRGLTLIDVLAVTGDQALPLALSLFNDLSIEILNDDD